MASTVIETSKDLLVDRDGGVVRLTLNRPKRRNALSRALVADLAAALDQIAADGSARVVVLAASGPVFCSGHDLGEMVGASEDEYRGLFADCSAMMERLRKLPQPVIARVHALATAAGCQLAAACDLVVAAEEASFATPGVKIGLFCGTPMVPLVRAIPPKPALEMLLTGRPITAARAFELGLVNRVVPKEQLDAAIGELCEAIVATSPLVVRLGKAAFYDQLALDEAAAYRRANELMVTGALARDAQEGISAFLEKRPPAWTGE
jgi:enoyl-CoA hydratase/carnithine racemase